MRAAQITRTDGPEAVEVVDLPEPAPDASHVVLEVHRAGVSYPDVLLTRGQYQIRPDVPFVPGAEVAGTVVSSPPGSGVTEGTRVAAFPGFGGFAERVAVPVPMVFPIPGSMSFDVAAALPMNYLTCLFALEHRGRLEPGETVLVHGASGGIGTAAIQVAKADGARVIAVVSDPSRGSTATDAGADDVVGAATFKDEVKELTGGRGVDVVVDPVGGERFTDSLRSLATEGRVLVIGFTGGSIPEVRVNRLLLGNIAVVGVGWGAYWASRPDYVGRQWARLLELAESGAINPPIGNVLPLDRASEAIGILDERRAAGKVILAVRD
jgi:NADPH2:quinone reductase